MDRDKIISIFSAHQENLALLHVESLYLFGSVARNEAKPTTDLDVMVKFKETPTFDKYMDLKFYLEDQFNCKIDLVTEDGVRKEIREYIEKEKIRVA